MASAPPDSFEFRTRLAPGRADDYVRFHRAIPADLDRAMRAAGVIGWRIHRSGLVLTHVVEARGRERTLALLEADPVNQAWQRQVAPYLDPAPEGTPEQAASSADARGELIWDMTWPTR
jgi:L-rhamnose mutarotase